MRTNPSYFLVVILFKWNSDKRNEMKKRARIRQNKWSITDVIVDIVDTSTMRTLDHTLSTNHSRRDIFDAAIPDWNDAFVSYFLFHCFIQVFAEFYNKNDWNYVFT